MKVVEDKEPVMKELTEGKDYLFIFVVDRSGSMSLNNRIVLTIEALKLFLRSLPLDSKFTIISFGSKKSIMKINGSEIIPVDNLNIKEAIQQVSTFKPDHGGTNILDPIKTAQGLNFNGKKRIFLLTDGMVDNPDKVV